MSYLAAPAEAVQDRVAVPLPALAFNPVGVGGASASVGRDGEWVDKWVVVRVRVTAGSASNSAMVVAVGTLKVTTVGISTHEPAVESKYVIFMSCTCAKVKSAE